MLQIMIRGPLKSCVVITLWFLYKVIHVCYQCPVAV
jgi:hypothetical protein